VDAPFVSAREKKSAIGPDGKPAAAEQSDLVPIGVREPPTIRLEEEKVIAPSSHLHEPSRQ
jgi:hypothetical protein